MSSHGHQHSDACAHGADGAAAAPPPPPSASPLDALEMKGITEVDLFQAVELGWLHRVRELLEAPDGLDLMAETRTVEKGTPLHFACLHGQVEILQYFLRCVHVRACVRACVRTCVCVGGRAG